MPTRCATCQEQRKVCDSCAMAGKTTEEMELDSAQVIDDEEKINALLVTKSRIRSAPSRSGSGAEPPPSKKADKGKGGEKGDDPWDGKGKCPWGNNESNSSGSNGVLEALAGITAQLEKITVKSDKTERKLDEMVSKKDLKKFRSFHFAKYENTDI